MFYVGLDIHSKRISICVLSETGQVVRRCQVRTIEEMMRILGGLSDQGQRTLGMLGNLGRLAP